MQKVLVRNEQHWATTKSWIRMNYPTFPVTKDEDLEAPRLYPAILVFDKEYDDRAGDWIEYEWVYPGDFT